MCVCMLSSPENTPMGNKLKWFLKLKEGGECIFVCCDTKNMPTSHPVSPSPICVSMQ